jgi:formylglycine-generating enzyme required for sulfatase activity
MDGNRSTRIPPGVIFLLVIVYLSLALVGACVQTRTATPNYSPGKIWIRSTDQAEMIYVPEGEFIMGSQDTDRKATGDEKPTQIVYLDAFWIDRTEVTNPQRANSGERKVFRGGSWGYPPSFIRVTDRARNRPSYAGFNIGFRCGASVR